LGQEIDGGSFFAKFSRFPEREGDYKLRVVEFVEETPGSNDDDRFKDQFFPPDSKSMGELIFQEKPDLKMQWIRASKLSDKGVVLFDKIEPNDVAQGMIGNCWLMASISALAEFPA